MSISDLFWVFFLLATVQPWLRQRSLEAARRALMSRIEKSRGSRLILLVHRQETMRLLGFPVMRYIDLHDWEEVVRAIDLTDPKVPIDLVLHTPGGLVLASLQIARAIKSHPGKVTVFVPHYAMSGGTLIALSANEILMCPHAVLGPVDPQLGQYPAASLLAVLEQKPIERIDDQTLVLADQARKAIAQVSDSVRELLAGTCTPEKADELARLLSSGRWTHDHRRARAPPAGTAVCAERNGDWTDASRLLAAARGAVTFLYPLPGTVNQVQRSQKARRSPHARRARLLPPVRTAAQAWTSPVSRKAPNRGSSISGADGARFVDRWRAQRGRTPHCGTCQWRKNRDVKRIRYRR